MEIKRILLSPRTDSEAIESYTYDTATKTLEIRFQSGSLYSYADVPRPLFTQFKYAKSQGRFFHDHIRNAGFPYAKLEGGQKDVKQHENATSKVTKWGETVKRFHLQRDVDESGVSGTGYVAEGVKLRNGMCVVWWVAGNVTSVVSYKDINEVEKIHGHGGNTKIVWDETIADSKGGDGSGNHGHGGLSGVHGGSSPKKDTAKDELLSALGFDLDDRPDTPPWRRPAPPKPSKRKEWWAKPTTKLDDDHVGWVDPNKMWKYHAINREEEDELSDRNPESGKRYLNELERDVERYGFLEPALFEYNPRRHRGIIGEGNHRLAVARRLDMELPILGLRHDGAGPLPSMPLPGTYEEVFKDLTDLSGRRATDPHFHFPKEFNPEPLFK